MAKANKVDWPKIRNEYLADARVSYLDLANKHGLTKRAVSQRGSDERWPELRQNFAEKAYNEFSEKLLDQKSSIQGEQLDNYKAMTDLVMQTTRSMLDKGAMLKDKGGQVIIDPDTEQPLYGQVDAFQLEKLARALDIAEKGRRMVLGLPTTISGLSNPDGSNLQGLSDLAARADEVPDDGPTD